MLKLLIVFFINEALEYTHKRYKKSYNKLIARKHKKKRKKTSWGIDE